MNAHRTALALAAATAALHLAGAASVARADEAAATPAAEPAAAPLPRREARRGDEGTFFLQDGRAVEGKLLTTSDNGDVIEQADGKKLFLPGHSVLGVVPRPPPKPWAGLAADLVRVELTDGTRLEGRLVERGEDSLVLAPAEGPPRRVFREEVAALYGPGGFLPRPRGLVDAARARALWSPTAVPLDLGEVTAGVNPNLAATAAAGFWGRTTLTATSTLPLWYASDFGASGALSLKASLRPLPWLFVAGGGEAFASSDGVVSSLFAAVTAERGPATLSLYAGPPPAGAWRLGAFGDRVFTASAAWRLQPRLSLLAEGWVNGGKEGRAGLGALGVRWFDQRFSVDAGLATAPDQALFPFVSFAFLVTAP
jgi:hypothetical protein